MKLSDWQDGLTEPSIPGLYQRKGIKTWQDKYYHYWDGEYWFLFGYDKKDAIKEYKENRTISAFQVEVGIFWRGLIDE